MTKMVEKITMQVKESQEEFIFETIYPYCEDILQIKINKEELKQILLNGMQKQPCEDCISREQTLKAFAEKCGGECACCEYNGSGYDTAENCKLIKSMPSVTPKGVTVTDFADRCRECGAEYEKILESMKPKGGSWIVHPKNIYAHLVCNQCLSPAPYDCKTNFCPNCGADMRVTRESKKNYILEEDNENGK